MTEAVLETRVAPETAESVDDDQLQVLVDAVRTFLDQKGESSKESFETAISSAKSLATQLEAINLKQSELLLTEQLSPTPTWDSVRVLRRLNRRTSKLRGIARQVKDLAQELFPVLQDKEMPIAVANHLFLESQRILMEVNGVTRALPKYGTEWQIFPNKESVLFPFPGILVNSGHSKNLTEKGSGDLVMENAVPVSRDRFSFFSRKALEEILMSSPEEINEFIDTVRMELIQIMPENIAKLINEAIQANDHESTTHLYNLYKDSMAYWNRQLEGVKLFMSLMKNYQIARFSMPLLIQMDRIEVGRAQLIAALGEAQSFLGVN